VTTVDPTVAKQIAAGKTERALKAKLGSDYAGSWLAKDGTTLTVGVTSSAAEAAVRKAGATPKLVDLSMSKLSSYKKTLDAALDADSTASGWYVDPPTNSVVVIAQPGGAKDAAKIATQNGVPEDALRVVVAKGKPKALSNVIGADPYIINNQFRCSVGFAVEGGFVTAGHCGVPGDTTVGSDNLPQGTVKASVFPGDGDFGFVETNADVTLQAAVSTSNAGVVPVAGSEESPIGAQVCRSGSTTGTHCGVIQAKNATVNLAEGAVTGLTQTDVCAEGGDSGGPWLTGDQAQGVTSSGNGDCTVGGTTFFQPLTEILDTDKLTLLTTANPGANPPAATDPAATDPAATDPAATDPAATDPAATDPAATDPAATDPAATDPAATDPAATDPAATDPAATDPAATDPAAAADPSAVDPAVAAMPGFSDQNSGKSHQKRRRH
jgi:streptogrisin C